MVAGRALVPAAAFLDMAAGCAVLATSSGDPKQRVAAAALSHVAIPTPSVLPGLGGGSGGATAVSLLCSVSLARGDLSVMSCQEGPLALPAAARTHLTAHITVLTGGSSAGGSSAIRLAHHQRPSHLALLGVLRRALVSSQPRSSAAQSVGCITTLPSASYRPAQIDCSLQLGALASGVANGSAILRVPAALDCFLAGSGDAAVGPQEQLDGFHASASVRPGDDGPTAVDITCDYHMVSMDGSGGAYAVSGMQAKQLKPEMLERLLQAQEQQQPQLPQASRVGRGRGRRKPSRPSIEEGQAAARAADAETSSVQDVLYAVQRVASSPVLEPQPLAPAVPQLLLRSPSRQTYRAEARAAALRARMLEAAARIAAVQQAAAAVAELHSNGGRSSEKAPLSVHFTNSGSPSAGLHALAKTLTAETSTPCSYVEADASYLSPMKPPADSASLAITIGGNSAASMAAPGLAGASIHGDGLMDQSGGACAAGVVHTDVLVPLETVASVGWGGLSSEISGDFQLVPRPPGALGSLVPVPVAAPAAGVVGGTVAVRVRSVGLNFRDLLMVRCGQRGGGEVATQALGALLGGKELRIYVKISGYRLAGQG